MNIKPVVYDHLTPHQRIIAAVEALSRGDDAEHEKLNRTCPEKQYKMADYHYSGVMQGLMSMAVAIELDLTGNALSMMLCLHSGSGLDDRADDFLQNIINSREAWKRQMEAMGIDPQAMDKIVKSLRHPAIAALLDQFANYEDTPDADEEAVKERMAGHEEFFKKFRNT